MMLKKDQKKRAPKLNQKITHDIFNNILSTQRTKTFAKGHKNKEKHSLYLLDKY